MVFVVLHLTDLISCAVNNVFTFFFQKILFLVRLQQLKSDKVQLEVRLEETKKQQGNKKGEVDAVLAEVANLKNSLASELPAKLSEHNKQLEEEQRGLEACRRDVDAKKEGRQLRKNELSMGITFYKERLGLSFERMPDNSLSLRMTLIDPENPARPFSFAVFVNAKNKYEVLRCEPRVDFDALLTNLNQDNNFSLFVQNMRRLFKKLV
jgi:kinetochore protein Spc25